MFYIFPSQRKLNRIYLDLLQSIGIHEPFDEKKSLDLIRANKPWEAVYEVAKHMGLPIAVMYTVVDDIVSAGHAHKSTQAQVHIPSNLPRYGSEEMVGFSIEVTFLRSYGQKPEQLLLTIAHELAHVYLHSTGSRYKESERETDIVAMLLGFWKLYGKARKVRTKTREGTFVSRLGYLNDSEFLQVYRLINRDYKKFRWHRTRLKRNADKLALLRERNEKSIEDLKQKIDSLYENRQFKIGKNIHQQISQLLHDSPVDDFENQLRDANHLMTKVRNQIGVKGLSRLMMIEDSELNTLSKTMIDQLQKQRKHILSLIKLLNKVKHLS